MPRFYLSPYIGSGIEPDRFRPRIVDGLSDWSSIDLSPKRGKGVALVYSNTPVASPFGVVDLGDSLDSPMPRLVSRVLENRLGITLSQRDRLRSIIAELLIVHGRADRWQKIRPNRMKRLEIWLGELVYEGPDILGASYSESFNQADSTTLGPDLTWTEIANNWGTVSNRATPQSNNGGTAARAEHDLGSDNHYVEGPVRYGASVSGVVGLAARFDSAAQTYYRAALDSAGRLDITRTVNGSNTDIASQSRTLSADIDYTIRVECNGSTIRARVDSDVWLSATDTQITGNTRFGMAGYRTTRDLLHDNISAADLVVPIRTLIGVGE